MTFISKPLQSEATSFEADAHGRIEPGVPRAFTFGAQRLVVVRVVREWRSNKSDRGDLYLKRHWYEIEIDDGRIAVVYFDRGAKRGAPRWWLFSL